MVQHDIIEKDTFYTTVYYTVYLKSICQVQSLNHSILTPGGVHLRTLR